VVALAAGVAVGGVWTASVGATTKPHLVVTPTKGLKNGSSVKVGGSGFTPGDTLFLVECLAKAKGQAGCRVVGIPPSVTVNSKGQFKTTTIKVYTGKVGNGVCGTKKSNLNNCAVSAGNATGGDSAVALIQFVLPKH